MALKNLTSDLSDYFKKKDPPKPTGRFQQPDRTMSDLDVHGKLETYKRPEIQNDVAGNPIIPTNFDQPDTHKRYTDNFESRLVRLASVDITKTQLEGRFESSPVKVTEVPTSGNNETSTVDPQQTNPQGRNDSSTVVIPDLDPTGRFTVSGIDPLISVLKGRFETSNVEPIESILEGRHAKIDTNGNNLPSIIEIKNTTTFGIQNPDEEGPAIFQYGKTVVMDSFGVPGLVSINEANTFLDYNGRIPSTANSMYSNITSLQPTPKFFPLPEYSILNGNMGHGTRRSAVDTVDTLTVDGIEVGNTIIHDHVTESDLAYSLSIPSIDQPLRGISYLIDPTTELFDVVKNLYDTSYINGLIGYVDPDGVTQYSLSNILGAPETQPDTYMDGLVPIPANYTIPFNSTDSNSVVFNFGYDIITNAILSNQGQTFTVPSSTTSPYADVTITGLHTGNIDTLFQNDSSKAGLDMVQTFVVDGQDTLTPISTVTITGIKNSFDQSTLDNSQVISTSLFGGKTYEQIGILDPTLIEEAISLETQIEDGIFSFSPNMMQNFSAGGEEGSNYIGIEGEAYTHPGLGAQYSHIGIYQSAFGTDSTPGDANVGDSTAIAYDENNHLTPGVLKQFTTNQTNPINYLQTNASNNLEFISEELQAQLSRTAGGVYIHRLGAYGMDTTVSNPTISQAVRDDLPKLYGNGAAEYGVPLGSKPLEIQTNYDASILPIGERYGDFVAKSIRSGEVESWAESAFPMLAGRNISSAKMGVDELKKMMKRKGGKNYRVWETHNSYTLQGNRGLHKGLEHFGIAAGGSSIADGWFPEVTNMISNGNSTSNKYYSVLGYPGLMVAGAMASAGSMMHVDFRALINDPLAGFYGEATIANYPVNNLFARGGSYNQGKPGLMRRDYRQPTSKVAPYGGDAITQQTISGTNIESFEKDYGDLIKFYIKDPIGGKMLRFRSYITAINDSLGASWTGVKYIGRPSNLYLYEGASDRKLSFNLKVAALSRYDVQMMWTKINYLSSLCYPHVSPSGQMIGPVVGLTLGDWFNDEPGFFDSINITVDTSSPWEINLEDERYGSAADGVGGQLLDSFKSGGIQGALNTGLNKVKDLAKGTLLNKSIDTKGKQVAQLPHVVDITLGFTSMASANRKVGGDMFGAINPDGSWIHGETGLPKKSAMDRLMGGLGLGGAAGAFAKSGAGKFLTGIAGGKF